MGDSYIILQVCTVSNITLDAFICLQVYVVLEFGDKAGYFGVS